MAGAGARFFSAQPPEPQTFLSAHVGAGNRLEVLPPSLSQLVHLEVLTLSSNHVYRLPDNIVGMEKLKVRTGEACGSRERLLWRYSLPTTKYVETCFRPRKSACDLTGLEVLLHSSLCCKVGFSSDMCFVRLWLCPLGFGITRGNSTLS